MSKCLLVLVGILAFSFAGCQKSNNSAVAATINPATQRGERVFNMQCAVCHNAHSREPLHGPGFEGLVKHPELPSGRPATDDNIRETIVNGRNMMPPLGRALDEQQIHDVIEYVKTL
jgi:mono/diheme cytochrome c family protein